MNRTQEDIRANRDYFAAKLRATKQRSEVLTAVQAGELDFLLLDTRPREAFARGHIVGAWSVPLQEIDGAVSSLPMDKEIVTYCWGHD